MIRHGLPSTISLAADVESALTVLLSSLGTHRVFDCSLGHLLVLQAMD